MIISLPEDRILRTFVTLPVLTLGQITRLWYNTGSLPYVGTLCKHLVDGGYLTRQALPSDIRVGSVPYVYGLSQKGKQYLDSLGYDLPGNVSALHSYPFLLHALAITDVLIAAVLLPTCNKNITLADIRHDLALKRLIRGYVVPDGFIDFRIHENIQQCLFLELDRGTESKSQIQKKLIGTLRFIQPAVGNGQSMYEQLFHTTSLTIAYAIVAQPEKRLSDIAHWTNEVLAETGNSSEADLFRFANISAVVLDPVWLFLTPIWKQLDNAPCGVSGFVPLVKV